jgi:hypothetical protein
MTHKPNKTAGEEINRIILDELVWYKRFRRFIFKPELTLSIKDVERIIKKLK